MTKTNKAVPLIAVVEGYSVGAAVETHGALTMNVRSKAAARLALSHADGIILTGGGDVDPSRYGAKRHKEVYGVDKGRDNLEFWIVKKARERGIPILGICRGSQVLNVAHGGTLDQNIYDTKGVTEHWGTQLWVKLSRRSRLGRHLSTIALHGSHYHHQAVSEVGRGLRAIAWAPDGIIEAIESQPSNPHYVLGVQFHPEMDYHYDEDARAVFEHFVWNIAAKFSHGRKLSAPDRERIVDAETPDYEYGLGYYGRKVSKPVTTLSGGDEWGSYLSGTKDEWEYEEWLRMNTQALEEEAEALGSLCEGEGSLCTSPDECLTWGECSAKVIRTRDDLRLEHVAWQSANPGVTLDQAIIEGKRGNVRGGAR